MYELITKYFYGEITAKEKKLLFTAMETDAELKKEFLSVQNLRALTSWIPAGEDESVAVGKLLEFKQARKEKSFVNYNGGIASWHETQEEAENAKNVYSGVVIDIKANIQELAVSKSPTATLAQETTNTATNSMLEELLRLI